jgi:hypothetical protein
MALADRVAGATPQFAAFVWGVAPATQKELEQWHS